MPHLNKRAKQLVVHGEQEFSFSTFAARISKPFSTFSTHFKKNSEKFLKRFLAALVSDMKRLQQQYSDFDFSSSIKA